MLVVSNMDLFTMTDMFSDIYNTADTKFLSAVYMSLNKSVMVNKSISKLGLDIILAEKDNGLGKQCRLKSAAKFQRVLCVCSPWFSNKYDTTQI